MTVNFAMMIRCIHKEAMVSLSVCTTDACETVALLSLMFVAHQRHTTSSSSHCHIYHTVVFTAFSESLGDTAVIEREDAMDCQAKPSTPRT